MMPIWDSSDKEVFDEWEIKRFIGGGIYIGWYIDTKEGDILALLGLGSGEELGDMLESLLLEVMFNVKGIVFEDRACTFLSVLGTELTWSVSSSSEKCSIGE